MLRNNSSTPEGKLFNLGRTLWLVTAALSCVVVGLLAVLSKASATVGIDGVMRDAVGGSSAMTGMGSDLGMYCWVAALTSGVFALILLVRNKSAVKSQIYYLIAMVLVSMLLFLDDRLMVHEYFHEELGIHEMYVFLGLMIPAGLFFVWGVKLHHLGGWPLLLTSIILFALSIVVDQMEPDNFKQSKDAIAHKIHYLVEDGLKLAGIIFWLVFVARTALRLIEQSLDRSAATVIDDEPALL